MVAHKVRGKLVVHRHQVAASCPPVIVLVGFLLPARGVCVVTPGVIGVDGTVDSVVVSAREGVLVETLLGGCALGVVEVLVVTNEELQMPLGWCGEGGRLGGVEDGGEGAVEWGGREVGRGVVSDPRKYKSLNTTS